MADAVFHQRDYLADAFTATDRDNTHQIETTGKNQERPEEGRLDVVFKQGSCSHSGRRERRKQANLPEIARNHGNASIRNSVVVAVLDEPVFQRRLVETLEPGKKIGVSQ